MPTLQFLEVPVSGTNQKAQVKLMFPPNFDPGSGKKIPVGRLCLWWSGIPICQCKV